MRTFALALLLAAAGDPSFRIEASRGAVELIRGTETRPVAGGVADMQPGDRLLLGKASAAAISDKATRALVAGPGELEINRDQLRWSGERITLAAGEENTQLVLDEGMVQLSSAEIRVRRDGEALYIEALQGQKVAFIGPAGYVDVHPQSGLQVKGSRTKAASLLAAPKPLYPAPHEAMRAFRFLWRPVKDAASYRFEVAADPLFAQPIYAGEVTGSAYSEKARALPIGLLFWRVTAKSADGFMGIPSEPQPARVAP
jgi:hypothetical protein